MSTNAQVKFYEPNEDRPIIFYQHYDGYDICEVVADALDHAKSRWNDPPYLSRAIFTKMLNYYKDRESSVKDDGLTGYGITLRNVFASDNYTVSVYSDLEKNPAVKHLGREYTASEFINIFLKKEV
jgi:hypothetical protein